MYIFRLLAFAMLALTTRMFAVETETWVHDSQADFEKGTLKNLSLRSDGLLTLAPAFREVFDASTAYLWALAQDAKGNLYAGGGGPTADTARLFVVDPKGQGRMLADLPGMEIHAIAIDKNDQVYAATAPDGKVYRVNRDGKSEVFYDPKAKYIWAMAFSKKGDLYVATGNQGAVHRVTPDGKGSLFFDTEEAHARSIAVDAQDNLIVGTEPGGLILRISPAGEGFVLYQAGKREVTSVAVGADGTIYAAAVGNKTPSPVTSPVSGLQLPPPPAAPGTGAITMRVAGQPTAVPAKPMAPPPAIAGGSEIYRIGRDNYAQRVWTHPQDIVYAIGFDGDGKVIAGTGNRGNIYRIDSEHDSTMLVNAAPSQVTAFSSGPEGRLFVATGNVAKIYQIGPKLERQGTYESDPLDVGFFSYWGRVSTGADAKVGTVLLETRSGNLDRPHKNWSAWAPIDRNTGRVASPSARFLQYRVTLNAAANGKSPELHEIEIAYVAKNVAPVIDQIDITPPNYRFPASPPPAPAAQTLNLPPLGGQRKRPASTLALDVSSPNPAMQYAKGHLGARWAASDPNSDELVYRVDIRGVQETEWKLLRDQVREKYLSWDSTAYSDGEYVLRFTASDAPGNPRDEALTTSLVSDRFTIDNTAPQISSLTGTRTGSKLTARWKARDGQSVIRKAEYSVNGADWTVVEPTTKLSDSPEHDYHLTIDTEPGERTVAIRVTDDFQNQTVDKVVIR